MGDLMTTYFDDVRRSLAGNYNDFIEGNEGRIAGSFIVGFFVSLFILIPLVSGIFLPSKFSCL